MYLWLISISLVNLNMKMGAQGAGTNKKSKLYDSRAIRAELTDENFKEGKLSVPEFLASRNFEIQSFELSQLKTKYASSSRCFQSLPRALRRRTASHNVKRVPKRLRNKALREMHNTLTGVPAKKKHSRGRELYRLRQSKKLLKLASKIKSLNSFPLEGVFDKGATFRKKLTTLKTQIEHLKNDNDKSKLNNSMGSFDRTGINELNPKPSGNLKYSKRQRHFVWIPSHVWHAKRFHMIKRWGYQIPLAPTQKCFKPIHRASKYDTVSYETSYYGCMIVESDDRFSLQCVLNKITLLKGDDAAKFFNGKCSYDDWLFLDGIAVGKGMVYYSPELKKILIRVHPSLYEEYFSYVRGLIGSNNRLLDCRFSIGLIEVCGPKLLNSLAKIFHRVSSDKILDLFFDLSSFGDSDCLAPGTSFSFSIKDPRTFKRPVFPPHHRQVNYNDLIIKLSQEYTIDKSSLAKFLCIDGRYSSYANQLTTKEIGSEFLKKDVIETNTEIPLFITKLKSTGNWCILQPWNWTLPMWLKINEISHLKVGGLKQLHQINFENSRPLYPTDYPFLKEGWLENKGNIYISEQKYTKRPKSKRQPFSVYESIVNPFGCDWAFLQKLFYVMKLNGSPQLSGTPAFGEFDEDLLRKVRNVDDVLALVLQCRVSKNIIPIELYEKNNILHQEILQGKLTLKTVPRVPVVQVLLHTLKSGCIRDNARIYRISPIDRDKIAANQKLTSPITDLVGFVTSGSYNLNSGVSTGIGCVLPEEQEFLLVRNVGSTSFHIVRSTLL